MLLFLTAHRCGGLSQSSQELSAVWYLKCTTGFLFNKKHLDKGNYKVIN